MRTATHSLALALTMLPAFAFAQPSIGEAVECTQRTNAATGAREVVCESRESAKGAAFVSETGKAGRDRRFRADEVVAAPPIGVVSTTDLTTTRAAAMASRARRNPAR